MSTIVNETGQGRAEVSLVEAAVVVVVAEEVQVRGAEEVEEGSSAW